MQATSRPMTADEQRQLKGAISSDGFGPWFILAVSPATTLFLQGQYLYETGEAGELLRSQIRIARAPTSRTVLDFNATGDVVRPVTRLPGGIYDQLPEDGEVLPVSLREAAERHGKRRNAEERRRRTRGSTPSRRA